MFSGIVRELGTVQRLEKGEDFWRLFVQAPMFAASAAGDAVQVGDSVSVLGVCLTHTAQEPGLGSFDIATETLRVSTLGSLEPGARLNLERSLQVGQRVDGHFVSGHVDVVAKILSITKTANTVQVEISLPPEICPFIAQKGSVSVDGVSLTVGGLTSDSFSLYIIPHTFEQTLFSEYKVGTEVNIEVDVLARYAVRALECMHKGEGEK